MHKVVTGRISVVIDENARFVKLIETVIEKKAVPAIHCLPTFHSKVRKLILDILRRIRYTMRAMCRRVHVTAVWPRAPS